MSTDEVYGDAVIEMRTSGCDENADFAPTNPCARCDGPIVSISRYSASKASAELLCDVYWRAYGLPITIPRCNNVYGPNQFPDKLVPRFIQLAIEKKPFTLHGEGRQRRVWVRIMTHPC